MTILRGPRRVVSYDDQLAIARAMHGATHRSKEARRLADHYRVTIRTIWRYAAAPRPDDPLYRAIRAWANDRLLRLDEADMATLLMVIARTRS